MRASLLLLVLSFVVAAISQATLPVIHGTWDDTICGLVPNSQQLYRQRSLTFGTFNNSAQLGSWGDQVTYYFGPGCDSNSQQYQVTTTGSYKFTGKQSEYLTYFWHINYIASSSSMVVYNQTFADYLNTLESCAFSSTWIPNVAQVINNVYCPDLNIYPLTQCLNTYDIFRRQYDRLYVGNLFVGEPPIYSTNCRVSDRPREYDPYPLTLYSNKANPAQPYVYSTFNIDPFINPDFKATSLRLTTQLGLNGSSGLSASLLTVAGVIVFAFVF